MNVALGSAFRNSAGAQVARWAHQCAALRRALGEHSLSLIAVEGDSTDSTVLELDRVLSVLPGVRVTHDHGGPWFGSTEAPARFKALAGVGNAILGAVPADADVLVYVESDLIWEADEILKLIGGLSPTVDVVAPMLWAGQLFYDVFAYRALDGQRFSPFPPYSHAFAEQDSLFVEVSSAGSCLVMKGDVARTARIPDEDGLVGFCRNARANGHRIWLDSDRIVRHPA